MADSNGNENTSEDLILVEDPPIEMDANCTVASSTSDSKPDETGVELTHVDEEVEKIDEEMESDESELQVIEHINANQSGNQLLTTGIKRTVSQRDAQYDSSECCILEAKNGEQRSLPKQNRRPERDIMTLKMLSDEAWKNEKRRRIEEEKDPASLIQKTELTKMCDALILWRKDIKKHFETIPGDYEHACNKCGRIFFHDPLLEDRIKLFPSEPHCLVCGKASVQHAFPKRRNRHGLPHVCEVCCNLIKHLLIHQLEEDSIHTFVCCYCSKSFTEPLFYRRHIENHRERPYRCSLCEEYYLSRQSMGDHIRKHIRDGSYIPNIPLVERAYPPQNLFLRF